MGFSVQLTKLVADSGVDLVLSKDNKKIAVQAKRYKRNIKVSNSTVLKTHGGRDIYGCDESLIVTTSYFTTQAIEDAKKLGIILWDRDDLSAKIDSINEKINSIRAKPVFPAFHLSLYKSLLSLHQFGGVFFIESKENGKYHIHRHGIRYPLVSFQARGLNKVTKCVLRMRGNKPVRENEGAVLIYSDSHYTYGSEEVAYTKVIECLNQFL
jgi:hypothetical protein